MKLRRRLKKAMAKRSLLIVIGLQIVSITLSVVITHAIDTKKPHTNVAVHVPDFFSPKPTPTPVATVDPCPTHSALTHDDLLIKINEARLSNHLSELSSNHLLDDYALVRAQEVSSNGSYEANNPHTTKYGDLFQWGHSLGRSSEGNKLLQYAELITGNQSNSCDTITAFLSSPTHRDSILDPKAKEVGEAVVNGYIVYEIAEDR